VGRRTARLLKKQGPPRPSWKDSKRLEHRTKHQVRKKKMKERKEDSRGAGCEKQGIERPPVARATGGPGANRFSASRGKPRSRATLLKIAQESGRRTTSKPVPRGQKKRERGQNLLAQTHRLSGQHKKKLRGQANKRS